MHDEDQTFIPESFQRLFRDARGRLTASARHVAARYELCEDMANLLTEHFRGVHFRDGVDEGTVLTRGREGLLAPPATFEPPEAEWVIRRAAELLGWPWSPQEAA